MNLVPNTRTTIILILLTFVLLWCVPLARAETAEEGEYTFPVTSITATPPTQAQEEPEREPVAVPVSATVRGLIYHYAAEYGVSGDRLYRVAMCETGGTLSPWAVGRAGETGIFQWHPNGEWWSTSLGRAGYPRPYGNATLHEDISMAAEAFARGRAGAWSCR